MQIFYFLFNINIFIPREGRNSVMGPSTFWRDFIEMNQTDLSPVVKQDGYFSANKSIDNSRAKFLEGYKSTLKEGLTIVESPGYRENSAIKNVKYLPC